MKSIVACLSLLVVVVVVVAIATSVSAETITVRVLNDNFRGSLEVDLDETVLSLKQKITAKDPSVPVKRQLLVHNLDILRDRQPLSKYGLKNNDQIIMIVIPKGALVDHLNELQSK